MNERRYNNANNKKKKRTNWYKVISAICFLTFIVIGLTSCNYEKPSERDIAEEVRMEKQVLLEEMEQMQTDIDRAFTKLEVRFETADFQLRDKIEQAQYKLNNESKEIGKLMMNINRTKPKDWEKVQHNTEISLTGVREDFQKVRKVVASIWKEQKIS